MQNTNLLNMCTKIAEGKHTARTIYKAAIEFYNTPLTTILSTFEADLVPLVYKYPESHLNGIGHGRKYLDDYERDWGLLIRGQKVVKVLGVIGTVLQKHLGELYGLNEAFYAHFEQPISKDDVNRAKNGIIFNGVFIPAMCLNLFIMHTFDELWRMESNYTASKLWDKNAYYAYREMCKADPIHKLVMNEEDYLKRNLWVYTVIEHIYRLYMVFAQCELIRWHHHLEEDYDGVRRYFKIKENPLKGVFNFTVENPKASKKKPKKRSILNPLRYILGATKA